MASIASTLTRSTVLYFQVTKPNVWWLLVFIGMVGYYTGAGGRVGLIDAFSVLLMLVTGTAGTEALSNYLERDIDSQMRRTRRRPIPRGLINPPWKALILGLVLMLVSLITASLINIMSFLFMLFGMLDYIVIYVMLSKRRTPWNIVLGSFAGGAPVIAGYVAATGVPSLEAWLLASLVILWIPSHVWSLALRYKEDYARACIPMLPVVVDERKSIRCIASTSGLLVVFSLILYLINSPHYGLLYLATASVLGSILLYLSMKLLFRPNLTDAWRLFKFTSPYLAIVFLVIAIEAAIVSVI
ncbi:MAG: heme o synthase [Aigarchaeota archaeon]|nr:heme o synthase [Aigarchaeota archaeon]MDW8092859.1 heme o synthase [Nitrososphaerota archaeon]